MQVTVNRDCQWNHEVGVRCIAPRFRALSSMRHYKLHITRSQPLIISIAQQS